MHLCQPRQVLVRCWQVGHHRPVLVGRRDDCAPTPRKVLVEDPITFDPGVQQYRASVRLPSDPPPQATVKPRPLTGRVSPVTRITFPACRAHYPGGSKQVHLSVASLSHTAFPVIAAGRHPHLRFRDLLRLHSSYGPLDRSTAQGGLCHEASARPVARPSRSSATRSNRQLSGWILLPLVLRAIGAH